MLRPLYHRGKYSMNAGWAPKLVWTLWRIERSLNSTRNRTPVIHFVARRYALDKVSIIGNGNLMAFTTGWVTSEGFKSGSLHEKHAVILFLHLPALQSATSQTHLNGGLTALTVTANRTKENIHII
jgi:hypothetical protein